MTGRFTGPYTMPKGASGRVPRLPQHYGFGEGGLKPPRGPFPGSSAGGRGYRVPGRWYRTYNFSDRMFRSVGNELWKKAGGGYMMLYSVDPAATRRSWAIAEAFMENFRNPFRQGDSDFDRMRRAVGMELYKDAGPFPPLEWGKVNTGGPGFYNMALNGWALGCSGVPSISFPQHKVVTHTISTAWLCAPVEEANFGGTLQAGGYGVAVIPAGIRTVAFPWGNSAIQIKGQNSERWNYPGGGTSPGAITFSPGTIVLPLDDPFEQTQMMPLREAQSGQKTRFMLGYQVAAMSMTIPAKGPPTKNPDDIHNRVPPGPGEKEDKPFDNSGRSVGDVYGALTELDDALDCMEQSFKKNPRPRNLKHVPINHRLDLRFRRLVNEALGGNVDWQKFVNCMAAENLKDYVIGRANREASRRLQNSPYSARRTSPIGWGVGGFSTRMR